MIAQLTLAPFAGVAAQYFVLGALIERRKLESTTTFLWLKESVLHFGSAPGVFRELETAVRFLAEVGQISIEGDVDMPNTWKLRLLR